MKKNNISDSILF